LPDLPDINEPLMTVQPKANKDDINDDIRDGRSKEKDIKEENREN
jgi:hypothetical protein